MLMNAPQIRCDGRRYPGAYSERWGAKAVSQHGIHLAFSLYGVLMREASEVYIAHKYIILIFSY